MSNGRGGDVKVNIYDDVADYDLLPPAVRLAVQNAAVPVSCAQIDELLDAHTPEDVIKMIESTGRSQTIYAHCFRSGEIEFSEEPSRDGMICLGSGPTSEFLRIVSAIARHGYQKGVLLVPGIPEAANGDEALDAVDRFKAQIALRVAT